jgi:hypothetical protein
MDTIRDVVIVLAAIIFGIVAPISYWYNSSCKFELKMAEIGYCQFFIHGNGYMWTKCDQKEFVK